jgi:hypothetical protein
VVVCFFAGAFAVFVTVLLAFFLGIILGVAKWTNDTNDYGSIA